MKAVTSRTSKRIKGQAVYKVTKDSGSLKKGDQFYLDSLHRDHLEVFDRNNNFKTVLNLDGTVNAAKELAGKGRKIPK
ncbi:MAG: hypothetical protein KZQ78_08440 [Candidatus Thiodiazotropha sp. (ex Ustalcina ferruginea)]|nr:hypothetical protein [Candidatus Thiodiazotropha sp. (ex Ustalcina ferruginea)]